MKKSNKTYQKDNGYFKASYIGDDDLAWASDGRSNWVTDEEARQQLLIRGKI